MARYRLKNEMRESRYWKEEEKKRCRLCGGVRETWVHVWGSAESGSREGKIGRRRWGEYWAKKGGGGIDERNGGRKEGSGGGGRGEGERGRGEKE